MKPPKYSKLINFRSFVLLLHTHHLSLKRINLRWFDFMWKHSLQIHYCTDFSSTDPDLIQNFKAWISFVLSDIYWCPCQVSSKRPKHKLAIMNEVSISACAKMRSKKLPVNTKTWHLRWFNDPYKDSVDWITVIKIVVLIIWQKMPKLFQSHNQSADIFIHRFWDWLVNLTQWYPPLWAVKKLLSEFWRLHMLLPSLVVTELKPIERQPSGHSALSFCSRSPPCSDSSVC